MKLSIQKTVAAVLAVVLTAALFASCGKKSEPKDSLIASETYTEATVQQPQADELTGWVREITGDENWNGDWSVLTDAQRRTLQAKFKENGYEVLVDENGVTYFAYTPTANQEEIAEVVSEVLPEKKWDGTYNSLTDDEKEIVRDALAERGYDVEVGSKGFEFFNAQSRKEETTRAEYNQLPNKEMLAALVDAELGMDGYKNWDGSFLSLTAEQRANIVKELNDYGYNVGINDKGEIYMLHQPQNTETFDSAYSAAAVGGTTAPQTTVVLTEPENQTEAEEDVTGTTASKTKPAPILEQAAIRSFGGTGSDLFVDIRPASDGGYIAVMQTTSKDGDFADADKTWKQTYSAVIKFDKDFNVQWKGMLGEKSSKTLGFFLEQAAELSDGSVVVVGYTNPVNATGIDAADCVIAKYAPDGTRAWAKHISGSSSDQFECVAATPDGGFIAGGQSASADGDFEGLHENCNDGILVKFNADGTREWIQSINGGKGATHFIAVDVTDAGYIYAACQASSTGQLQLDAAQYAGLGSSDGLVFKLDPNGAFITHRAIGGSGADTITCLAVCDEGGVLVGGYTTENKSPNSVFAGQTNQGNHDAYLVRLDASLNVEWVNTYGGTEGDEIHAVAQTRNGFVAVGESRSKGGAFAFLGAGETDGFILTVSSNGTTTEKYALLGGETERVRTVFATNKQVVAAGATQSINGMFTSLSPAPNGKYRVGFLVNYSVQ